MTSNVLGIEGENIEQDREGFFIVIPGYRDRSTIYVCVKAFLREEESNTIRIELFGII